MDMIDTSPGPDARVSPVSTDRTPTETCLTVFLSTAGARGAVLPSTVLVPHGAGQRGGDCGRHQTGHPSGQVHLLLHLLLSGRSGSGGGHEEVSASLHFSGFELNLNGKFGLVLLAL